MASTSRNIGRTIRRNADREMTRNEIRQRLVEYALFGQERCPDDECILRRRVLVERFRKLMAEYEEQRPNRLWNYLQGMRDEWAKQGKPPSVAMDLADDIIELKRLEEVRRNAS